MSSSFEAKTRIATVINRKITVVIGSSIIRDGVILGHQ